MQNALETHLFHDSWQGLRLLPTVRHTVLFPLLPCSPLEYCFCSALSKLTFGMVRLSFLQFGDDSFGLSFYRIWQLTGKEHEDILWLSVMLLFLLTLSSVCSTQGLDCSPHPHNSHVSICTFASSGSALALFHSALLLIPSEGVESRHEEVTESIKSSPPESCPRGPTWCPSQGSLIHDFSPHYGLVKLQFA